MDKHTSQNAFIQVRMGSTRYPGKSLAPIADVPLIKRVIDRVNKALPKENIIILTTDEAFDDPLVAYIDNLGVKCYRGHPTNVFQRFRSAINEYPCESFFRVCGDNPFLETSLLEKGQEIYNKRDYDIVTSEFTRDFPPGITVELINSDAFSAVDAQVLSESQKEHVTTYFYENSEEFDIYNIECPVDVREEETFAVNSLEDLKTIEEKYIMGKLNEDRFKFQT